MGISPDDLPEPLRTMVLPDTKPFAFHRFPLTQCLLATVRAALTVPPSLRADPLYGKAKAIELMCLLIDLMRTFDGTNRVNPGAIRRNESRLNKARDLIAQHFAQNITIEEISKEVGLNRLALTSGFRELFGVSVYDYLQKSRMERAFELLQDEGTSVSRVAEAVGFSYASNFSTAFHGYFGYPPGRARGLRR
jgi:AraC family transcriptional activator of pyochelin receptor